MISRETHLAQRKPLTPEELCEVNELRCCGFPLAEIATAWNLTEYELRIQISFAERLRQINALVNMGVFNV